MPSDMMRFYSMWPAGFIRFANQPLVRGSQNAKLLPWRDCMRVTVQSFFIVHLCGCNLAVQQSCPFHLWKHFPWV